MPLLDRKLFVRNKPPKDLDPNEELFYCKATHEVFRQYDAFFDRVILCNSLVWTCAMTGKSNITFQEAVESEENARISLRTFPQALKKPILYLASLTRKSRLNEMCDDVFNYMKDRYFIGEEVEALINGVKKSCEVTQVILPERPGRSPAKSDSKQKPKDIAPNKIKYEVVDYNSGRTSVVKAENLSRPKGTYTKPRNKLFLKQHTELKGGVFKVKDKIVSKLKSEFQFSEVFSGPLPAYAVEAKKALEKADKNGTKTGKRVVQGKLNFKKETMEERKKALEKMVLLDKQKMNADKEKQKVKEGLKKQMEDVKLKQKEEKLKEKQKKLEEKKRVAEYLNTWKKPRDDLECDDLKDLPVATPVDCGIPPNCFGDALMILEFLNTFSKQIQLKDNFPHGFNFDHIEKALVETDIQGVFNDLLQLLLTALFRYQEAEYDSFDIKKKTWHELGNLTIDQAMDVAQITSTWPQQYHGTLLRNLPLDSFSVTEILRLHLLSSGCRPRVSWQGVVSPSEDPGLFFKIEEAELLKKLSTCSVFDLNCEERCKILTLLTHQLLASDVLRYAIDEYADNTKPMLKQLRELRMNFARKQKEFREDINIKKKGEKDETNKQNGMETSPQQVDEEEKENSKNLTPVEKEALTEKRAKEEARLKAEFVKKEREIESQIRKLQSSFNLAPIGRDRAFRRYWVFQTIAGVFVEDDDPFKGNCLLKPVPQISSFPTAIVKPETSSPNIKKYLVENDSKNSSSDKENEILRDLAIVQSELPFPIKNRKLSDLNLRVDSKKSILENTLNGIETCLQCVNKSDSQDNYMLYCPHSKTTLPTDQCSANIDTCLVHNLNAPRTIWSFYYQDEELDALINALNPRGFRERSLKDTLLNEKERIKELVSKCAASSFNKNLPKQEEQVRKSQRHQNSSSSHYSGMQPQVALELTLRDMIIEFEQRIFSGGLGCLKVGDREAWKAAIEQGGLRNKIVKEEKDEVSLKDDIEADILKLSLPVSAEKVLQDLAIAMLQLSQGIEAKYLNPPLGDSDEQKKARQKQQQPESEVAKPKTSKVSPLERWQESLMQCTSLSQLFVYLGTLERSVAWSRSVLKAHCKICRRRGDAENMLLCDGCNRGHHLYCLKPPLKVIPEGDWFCLSCKPVEVPVSPTKKNSRKEESEESEAEGESDGDEEMESEEDEEEESEDNDESNIVQESCEACGDVGTLLCCDGCPLMYHAECVNLKRIPRGEWLCPKCSKKEESVKKAQKYSANGNYGTRSSSLTSDKKKSNPSLKTKMCSKGTKRKYEDSFEDEFEPPAKKANNRNSAQNAARRRSKTGGDSNALDYKACIDMISELMRHESSWPFLVPVSKKDAPGYHQKIKRPMDLGTIRSNLNCMKYKNNQEFVHDIYLVLHNCWLFNPRNSPEYKAAEVLHREMKRLFKEYEIADSAPKNGELDDEEEEEEEEDES